MYFSLLALFSACESSHETDNDRNLINEEKVQEEYEEVKEDLKGLREKMDSTGNKIGKDLEEVGNEIEEEF